MSLRDTILQADDLPTTTIDIPAWDVKVGIRGMNGKEQAQFQQQAASDTDRAYFYADLLIALVTDPDTGQNVFDQADRDTLVSKSGAVLDHVAAEIIRLSSISDEEADAELEADPTFVGA